MRFRLALPLILASSPFVAPAHVVRAARQTQAAPQQQQQPARSDIGRINELLKQGKLVEALPLLEAAAAAEPSNGEVVFYLGFVRSAAAKGIADAGARRRARVQARKEMLRAKELGYESELLDAGLASITPDGGDPVRFSENPQVEAAMNEGEVAFSRGDFALARKAYERALALDPAQYHAALFIGDSYFKEGHAKPKGAEQDALYAKAGEAFARAIKINPDIETAYRYWGSALMDGGKMDEALQKVVEAYITDPYNRSSAQGLARWAQMNNLRELSHPRVEVPVALSAGAKSGDTNITLRPPADGAGEDGSSAWTVYGLSRAAYRAETFKKNHPGEKAYRHTLREEAEALRAVARAVREEQQKGKVKRLDPSLANLVKLDDEGLLEAYVLLARPDAGIAQDYAAYRKADADKLRRYVRQYVMRRGERV